MFPSPSPHTLVHPALVLRRTFMVPAGITPEALAPLLNIDLPVLLAVLAQQAPLSPAIAFRLESLFGLPAEAWISMQKRFDQQRLPPPSLPGPDPRERFEGLGPDIRQTLIRHASSFPIRIRDAACALGYRTRIDNLPVGQSLRIDPRESPPLISSNYREAPARQRYLLAYGLAWRLHHKPSPGESAPIIGLDLSLRPFIQEGGPDHAEDGDLFAPATLLSAERTALDFLLPLHLLGPSWHAASRPSYGEPLRVFARQWGIPPAIMERRIPCLLPQARSGSGR